MFNSRHSGNDCEVSVLLLKRGTNHEQSFGKKIAILSTDGFEQVELTEPKKALEQAGAKTEVISPHSGEIKGWKSAEWGDKVKVDRELKSAKADDYDALLIPGGVMNPDKLRMDPTAINFVKKFFDSGKPVAAICHGPQMLIEAGVVKRTQADLVAFTED